MCGRTAENWKIRPTGGIWTRLHLFLGYRWLYNHRFRQQSHAGKIPIVLSCLSVVCLQFGVDCGWTVQYQPPELLLTIRENHHIVSKTFVTFLILNDLWGIIISASPSQKVENKMSKHCRARRAALSDLWSTFDQAQHVWLSSGTITIVVMILLYLLY